MAAGSRGRIAEKAGAITEPEINRRAEEKAQALYGNRAFEVVGAENPPP